MSQIEIKATVDLKSPTQVAAAMAFMQALASPYGGKQEPSAFETIKNVPADKEELEVKEPPIKKAATKKKEAVKKEEIKKESEVEEQHKEAKESESDVSITEVRRVLSTLVEVHREAIKTKLKELGANSVSTLDSSKYDDFYTFLNSL